jgi:hypothetical protein
MRQQEVFPPMSKPMIFPSTEKKRRQNMAALFQIDMDAMFTEW